MNAVHQVLAGAAPGDAVTEQALRLQALLRAWGHRSDIIAQHLHPAMSGRVRRLSRHDDPALREGALILRYSIWGGAAEAALASGSPLAIIYHNVTPGSLLRAANPEIGALCDVGRAHIGDLRGHARVLLADSSFNAIDLADAGVGTATVVPLLIDPVDRPPPPGPPTDQPRIVSVGRVAPNKRLEDAVRITAVLQRGSAQDASLSAVGSADSFDRYLAALKALVGALHVRNVAFTGRVSDDERDRAYADASVYICMSIHEGFCMPLVEAMQRGVPIVARAAGAVPETLGQAGLCLDDDDPRVFAEAVLEVSSNATLRAHLAEAARARLDDLHPRRTADRLREALAPITEGGS